MREHVTEALVLDKIPVGEFDARVFLFTPRLGKVSAKITSARKITSKLSPHLEPLMCATVRLIEKGGFQLTDVLSYQRMPAAYLSVARVLLHTLEDGYPDRDLWHKIFRENISSEDILAHIGFDVEKAVCVSCGSKPDYFNFRESAYYCRRCVPSGAVRTDYLRCNA